MEEGKGARYLASGRQYGNALLGVRHQEEEKYKHLSPNLIRPFYRVCSNCLPSKLIQARRPSSRII